ncbi:MAG: hypothetical protein QNJ45_18835 [Ardenticatenaceae bacterium]|nr:hypothetical protein [Ardenticatenaceae bacterium]
MDEQIITIGALENYLTTIHQRPVHLQKISTLGDDPDSAAQLKGFGYGQPIRIWYEVDKCQHDIVIRPVLRNGYGRERESDRVAEVWRDYHNFNLLEGHVPAIDIVGIQADRSLVSLKNVQECILLTPYATGIPYAEDLLRIRDSGEISQLDRERARAIALYLVEIHAVKHHDPLLWRRRLRDLVGHGEGIMGIIDGYGHADFVSDHTLRSIEDAANHWRWRLKDRINRLCQVHGDFHPFNILFGDDLSFQLIDRSRGSWGAPSDDVAALSINYLFFALQMDKELHGPFQELYEIFWTTYLHQTDDMEILQEIAPWIAWRALVLASPEWYPKMSHQARQRLINFACNVLADGRFDWQGINHYLGVL